MAVKSCVYQIKMIEVIGAPKSSSAAYFIYVSNADL